MKGKELQLAEDLTVADPLVGRLVKIRKRKSIRYGGLAEVELVIRSPESEAKLLVLLVKYVNTGRRRWLFDKELIGLRILTTLESIAECA